MRSVKTIILLSLFSIPLEIWAQGIDITTIPGKIFFSVNIYPSIDNVYVSDSKFNKFDLSKSGMINPSFCIEYMFLNGLGLKTGLGFSMFSKNMNLDNFLKTIQGIDSDNDSYELTITGKQITEKDRLFFIDVPVGLIYVKPISSKFDIYVSLGIIFSKSIYTNYDGSGVYTFEAFYPAYNLTLKNIPEHGLYQEKSIEGSNNLELVPIVISGNVDAGIDYKIKRDFSVFFGIHFLQSFNNVFKKINNGIEPPALPYSSVPDYKNLIETSTNTIIQSFGFHFSLRYLLK